MVTDAGVTPPAGALWGTETYAASLHSFNLTTGAILATLTMTDGITIAGTNGMCWDPVGGVMRVVVHTDVASTTVNTATAALAMVAGLADGPSNDTDGESLVMAGNGSLYRFSGNGDPKYFGSVSATGVEAEIATSALIASEVTAAAAGPAGTMYITTLTADFATVTTTGTVTPLAPLQLGTNIYLKGMAYIPAP